MEKISIEIYYWRFIQSLQHLQSNRNPVTLIPDVISFTTKRQSMKYITKSASTLLRSSIFTHQHDTGRPISSDDFTISLFFSSSSRCYLLIRESFLIRSTILSHDILITPRLFWHIFTTHSVSNAKLRLLTCNSNLIICLYHILFHSLIMLFYATNP